MISAETSDLIKFIFTGSLVPAMGYIVWEIRTIRKEAREGRKEMYKKLDVNTKKITTLEAQHKINHPGQG